MQYRRFGDTGHMISALGFGAMRLPGDEKEAIDLLKYGIDKGINYIDTAFIYGESEIRVGKAVKGIRDKVMISTKNPLKEASASKWREQLETSLKRLDMDYIDFYHMHGLTWKEYTERFNIPGGPIDEAAKAKEKGYIRFLSFSSHDTPDNIIKLIDTGLFATLLVQYNLLDRTNEGVLEYAHNKGMGTVVMGPVGGGRLGFPSDKIQQLIPGGSKSSPEIALRFVLSNPNVSCALSGMGNKRMVDENTETASREGYLTEDEKRRIEEAMEENKRLADLYCTGCNYCMPCPNGVNIPENFKFMNYHRVYGLTDYAKQQYRELRPDHPWIKGKKAEECIECGQCEPKCPQKIPIIEQLKETARVLGGVEK